MAKKSDDLEDKQTFTYGESANEESYYYLTNTKEAVVFSDDEDDEDDDEEEGGEEAEADDDDDDDYALLLREIDRCGKDDLELDDDVVEITGLIPVHDIMEVVAEDDEDSQGDGEPSPLLSDSEDDDDDDDEEDGDEKGDDEKGDDEDE